jgi:hypothetical protein
MRNRQETMSKVKKGELKVMPNSRLFHYAIKLRPLELPF